MAQPVAVTAEDYPRVFEAGVQALRDLGFEVDRQDYRFGVVTSKPLGAPSLLEPWNRTNTTGGQMVESTLNDQRRTVRIQLEPRDGASDDASDASVAAVGTGDYQVRVEVVVERRQTPGRRLTRSTSRPRMYNRLREVPTHLREMGVPRTYWMPIGRDEQLEARLLAMMTSND